MTLWIQSHSPSKKRQLPPSFEGKMPIFQEPRMVKKRGEEKGGNSVASRRAFRSVSRSSGAQRYRARVRNTHGEKRRRRDVTAGNDERTRIQRTCPNTPTERTGRALDFRAPDKTCANRFKCPAISREGKSAFPSDSGWRVLWRCWSSGKKMELFLNNWKKFVFTNDL